MRPGRSGTTNGASELQRESKIPIVVGKLQEVATLGVPGIIDEEVQPPECLDGSLNRERRDARISEVCGNYECWPGKRRSDFR